MSEKNNIFNAKIASLLTATLDPEKDRTVEQLFFRHPEEVSSFMVDQMEEDATREMIALFYWIYVI